MHSLATDLARVVEVLNHVDNLAWRRKWSYDDIGRIREARAIIATLYTRAARGGLNEPFGNPEQLASLEQRAEELLQAARSGWFDASDPVPHGAAIRAITAALANQQGMEYDLIANGVAESIENGDGVWVSCTGCLETEDGYHVGRYPYSKAFRCHLGGGCSECGGIGAVWDTTDYAAFGDEMAGDTQPAAANQQGVGVPDVSDAEISAWLDRHDLSHALRGADARAAFEDAQSFLLTMQPTQLAGDMGPTCNRNCDCVGPCKAGIEP